MYKKFIEENKIDIQKYVDTVEYDENDDIELDEDIVNDIAIEYGMCRYYIIDYTLYNQQYTEVFAWNDIIDDWIDLPRHADINNESDEFETREEAEEALNAREEKIETELEKIEASATEEEIEEYEEYVENYKKGRDSYYGYCMNGGGGRREFSKMYGNGECCSLGEWLLDRRS